MTTIEERAPLPMLLTPTERDELAKLLARVERMALDLAATLNGALEVVRESPAVPLGTADDLEQYRLADGTVSHVFEHARQIAKGDWIQALHGDTEWERVDQDPIHAETQTGLPTRNLAGQVRLRWWGNEDLVRVAETPVRVVAGQERRWDR